MAAPEGGAVRLRPCPDCHGRPVLLYGETFVEVSCERCDAGTELIDNQHVRCGRFSLVRVNATTTWAEAEQRVQDLWNAQATPRADVHEAGSGALGDGLRGGLLHMRGEVEALLIKAQFEADAALSTSAGERTAGRIGGLLDVISVCDRALKKAKGGAQ